MPDDYREIDDRYDRMTENVNRMMADRAEQERQAQWRNQVAMSGGSSGRSAPVSLSGIVKMLIGCAILIVILFIAAGILGWAIATFAH